MFLKPAFILRTNQHLEYNMHMFTFSIKATERVFFEGFQYTEYCKKHNTYYLVIYKKLKQ